MLELIRLPTAALRHPAYGVNAQLGALPRYKGDPSTPEIKAVYDVSENFEPTQRVRPLDYPVIVVSLQRPIESDQEWGPVLRDYASVPVYIDIVVGAQDTADRARDLLYYFRAIIKCLRDWLDGTHVVDQSANEISILYVNRLAWGPVDLEMPSGRIIGTVVPDFFARDTLV